MSKELLNPANQEIIAATSAKPVVYTSDRDQLVAMVSELCAESVRVSTQGRYHVWCWYSGHVDAVSLRVSFAGEIEQRIIDEYMYLDGDRAGVVAKLADMIDRVSELGEQEGWS